MSEDSAIAVESLPIPEPRQREQLSVPQPKRQPPYAVIVFNDNVHSFKYVVETFMKVFGYPQEKSFTLALQIHNKGKGIVWSGMREVAELKRDQIRSAGPDFYAIEKVESPLSAIVEPLPG
jgi:ATP-dependent Clp protease adaptor protein ClpS